LYPYRIRPLNDSQEVLYFTDVLSRYRLLEVVAVAVLLGFPNPDVYQRTSIVLLFLPSRPSSGSGEQRCLWQFNRCSLINQCIAAGFVSHRNRLGQKCSTRDASIP